MDEQEIEVVERDSCLMFLETLLAFAEKASKQEILAHLRNLIADVKQLDE